MALHLSLLDHAVEEFLSGHAAFEQLTNRDPAQRTSIAIVRAITSLHLGIDKAVKHALYSIDPALIIKSLTHETLRGLQRERLDGSIPTIFAVSSKVETHHLIGLLHIAREFVVPSLSEQVYDDFVSHVKDLTDIRNQAVHKEFYGDFDYVAAVVSQVLSRFREVMSKLSPAFLSAASAKNDQLLSRLKAAELEVDAAWQVLVDYLSEGSEISLNLTIWITIQPSSEWLLLNVSGDTAVSDAISAVAVAVRDTSMGFLHKELPPPAPVTVEGLLGPINVTGAFNVATAPLGSFFTTSSLFLPQASPRVVAPPEASNLRFAKNVGSLSLKLKGRRKSSLGASVQISNFEISFEAGVQEGKIKALLSPLNPEPRPGHPQNIRLEGIAIYEGEFVIRETTERWVAGTTMREIRGRAHLALDDPDKSVVLQRK